MADCEKAVVYVLQFEDATGSGVITHDDGGRTRFGIAEKFHPELAASLFYSSMGSEAALKIAEGIYQRDYCEPLCIALMKSQEIANKLLSLGVNCGVTAAAKMLQDALYVSGDGRIGPITLDALDHADPEKILYRLRGEAVAYYEGILQANPSLEVYRAGWLARAEA